MSNASPTRNPKQWTVFLVLTAITRTTSPFLAPLQPFVQSKTRINSSGTSADDSGRRGRLRQPRLPEQNLYDVLGADQNMSRTEIKRLYLELARATHPDSQGAASASDDAGSADFNRIARAWTVLSDRKTRRAYDRELAAEDFKENVARRAGAVAKEVGPPARRFYDDVAIPFLRRTTASTLAGWTAAAEMAAADGMDDVATGSGAGDSQGRTLAGVTLSEIVSDLPEEERRAMSGEDFVPLIQRVVEAGRDATRKVRGGELQEQSMELQRRCVGESTLPSLVTFDSNFGAVQVEKSRRVSRITSLQKDVPARMQHIIASCRKGGRKDIVPFFRCSDGSTPPQARRSSCLCHSCQVLKQILVTA